MFILIFFISINFYEKKHALISTQSSNYKNEGYTRFQAYRPESAFICVLLPTCFLQMVSIGIPKKSKF